MQICSFNIILIKSAIFNIDQLMIFCSNQFKFLKLLYEFKQILIVAVYSSCVRIF